MNNLAKTSESFDSEESKFLAHLVENRNNVSIFLRSGIKLTGRIQHYDEATVILHNVNNQLIYKHAISTILPSEHGFSDL